MENKNIDSKQVLHAFLKNKRCLCMLSFGCLFIIMATALLVSKPLTMAARYMTSLNKGSELYGRLKGKMNGVSIEIYLFNITNADRFMSGHDHKLKLEEVGPFVYRQERTHKGLSIDDERHILRYTPSNTNAFDLAASVGDPSTMHLMLPNIPLLLILSKMSKENYFIRNAFNMLAKTVSGDYSNSIINITVQEYLWGYNDPLVKLGHQVLPGVFHFKTLGLLDRFFDPVNYKPLDMDSTDDNKFSIKRMDGIGGLKGLGYADKPTRCNSFNETYEGIIFPFNLSPERNIRLYHTIYCRMLDLEYMGTEDLEFGNQGLVYRIRKDAFTHNEENSCLCPKGQCPNGISDVSSCFFTLPLGLSLAHFLYANDSSLTERIEGLKPNETLHGSRFLIDKEVGVSLETSFAIQYNLMVGDVQLNTAKPFANMVVPFVWIKVVQPPLPDDVMMNVKVLNLYMPKVLTAMEVLFLFIGLVLIIFSYRKSTSLHFNRKMDYRNPTVRNLMNTNIPLMVDSEKC